MRKTLFAAAALAPLWFFAAQTHASAATTISNSTGTPVTTAADGDITITSSGSVSPSNANGGPGTAAVTVNSNNSVSNAGTISYKDVNDVVGIAIQGGNTGSVTNTGTITINETFTPKDANSDGVPEAPFASTTSAGRFGIRLTGTQPFVGNILNSGSISVQGSNDNGAGLPSYGVSLEAQLQGNLTNSGSIVYIGDGGGGIRETAGVTGNVLITGGVTAQGEKSNAIVLGGDVGGRVSIYSGVTSTDYGATTRNASPTVLTTIQNQGNAEVNPDAGSAVVIAGNVGQGVFIGAAPANTNTTDTTTDRDGDGIVDNAETAGSIITYGMAPALAIGGPNNITIGPFAAAPVTAGANTGDNGFGLVVEGRVAGEGVYDGVPSTGVQIGAVVNSLTGLLTCGGGSNTCGTTSVTGGLQVTGSVEAISYAASATGLHIGAGATVPTISNTGTISATIAAPNTNGTAFNSYNGAAIAILIDGAQTGAGLAAGSVSTLFNSGTISASVTGDAGDSVSVSAVVDKGGGITSVTNTGAITATFAGDATGAVAPANQKLVALDLSANTTGTTLTQQQAPNQIVTTTTANSITTSVISTSAPTYPLTQTIAPTVTTTTNGDTTVTTTVATSPSITGDILLGNGSNTVNILAGTVTGGLSLGSGATGSVTIDNGATYGGTFTYTGGALALNVNNGTFANTSASASTVSGVAAAYNLSSLKIGSAGVVFFGVDPVNNRAAEFLVSGAATIASGAKIGLDFISNATSAQTYTLVKAGSLSVGETDTALAGPVPYIFNSTITTNAAAGTISLTISPKTAAQLGLNPSQAAALPATYQALTLDTPVQTAFLNQFTRGGFLNLYNQLLPDYAGGTFQAANAASQAISRATAENNDIENPSGSRGAWAQEIVVGVNQGAGQTDGFRGGGFGFVGGVETGGSGLGAFGVTAAFVSTSISDPHIPGDSQTALSELEFGGYWQGEFDGFLADARVGAGYTFMNGRREIVQTNSTGDITLDRKVKSDWNGYTLSGHFGLAYKWNLNNRFFGGGWFLQPQAHIDYFRLNENAYKDNEAQGGPALAMAFDSRTGQETSGTASIVFGRKLGTGLVWRPSLELGVRDVFTGDAGDTVARFISGGPAFTLTPADITGAAGIARFKIKASSEYYEVGVEAGGEVLSSRYQEGDMKASFRILF